MLSFQKKKLVQQILFGPGDSSSNNVFGHLVLLKTENEILTFKVFQIFESSHGVPKLQYS